MGRKTHALHANSDDSGLGYTWCARRVAVVGRVVSTEDATCQVCRRIALRWTAEQLKKRAEPDQVALPLRGFAQEYRRIRRR